MTDRAARLDHIATPSSPRRTAFLAVLAAGLGIVGGFAAWVLVHLIGLVTNVALYGQIGWTAPPSTALDPGLHVVVAAVLGSLVIVALAKWAPAIKGHGIPEAMEAVLLRQSRVAPRMAIAKPISAAIAIGTGAPFGAEGPIIVTGGSLGSLIGQVLHVTPSERKALLAAGAAAGMAATFGAPLASVVLAVELLLFELSARSLIPLIVAASVAGGMHGWLFESGPFFPVPTHEYAGLASLPAFLGLGLCAGALAVVIVRGLSLVEAAYDRLPVSPTWHPVVGAVVFASLGLFAPRALGVGYDAIGDILADDLAWKTVAGLALAKLVIWWIALGSGTSGGTLAPILMISAGMGSLYGTALGELVPALDLTPGAFAVVAMAATFGAAARAPFTAIVFVVELTHDQEVVLPIMLATVVADLVARAGAHDSIMTEKLTRRGVRVGSHYEVDPFRTTTVRQIMTTTVESIPAAATWGDVRGRFESGRHSAYPFVDDAGRCVGIVARGDLLREEVDDDAPALEHVDRDVVVVRPDDVAIVALGRIADEGVEHLPVLDGDGAVVGICTRTDLLGVRRQRSALERAQPGWASAWRPRR